MHLIPRLAFSFLLLTAIGFAPSAVLFAQSVEPIEPTQIYKNVDFVAVGQITKMKEYLDDEQKEDLKTITDWIEGFADLDASKCDEVICQFGADEYVGGEMESVGFLFRREADFEAAEIDSFVDKLGMENDEHEGAKFYHMGREPAFYFKGNSMLIGEQARAKLLIETEKAEMSREVAFLENVPSTADICVGINFEKESFREMFMQLLDDMRLFKRRGGGDVDPDEMVSLMDKLATANLQLRLSEMNNLELRLKLKDAATSEEAKAEAEAFVGLIQGWVDEINGELDGAPAGLKESMGALLNIFSEMLGDAEYSVEGDEIVVVAKHDDAKKLPGLFTQSMKTMVGFMGGF